jgi:glycosyltransferase involved in cell wall biosynthesis
MPPAAVSRVVLTGQQPPEVVAAAYALADVFAFPSRTDTQALVLQEAALAGVPVVAADPVLLRDGPLAGAGVCPPDGPGAFAAALHDLLDDPARAAAVSVVARANASRHTPARYAGAVVDVYRHAHDRHARRANPANPAIPADDVAVAAPTA